MIKVKKMKNDKNEKVKNNTKISVLVRKRKLINNKYKKMI